MIFSLPLCSLQEMFHVMPNINRALLITFIEELMALKFVDLFMDLSLHTFSIELTICIVHKFD